MRGCLILALGLFVAVVTGPALAAGSSAADTVEQARDKALLAFQRDLVSVLAPRADAMPLLGAALLARPLANQPKHNTFHSLIERAAAAPDSGPAVSWARLVDCDARADACPNKDALQQLLAQAPDNAAVWLLKLGQDMRDNRRDDTRADLARAAAAKLYDDYAGASLQALASTVSVLPPPQDTIDPKATAGAYGVQAMLVLGVGSAQPQPALRAAAQLCEHGADDTALRDDCLKLGKTLEWGSSPLARSLGLHLREVLSPEPAQQEQARQARRDLVWQVRSFARLTARVPTDQAEAQHLLALARHGGTEMSLLLAALRDAGIPTTAPAAEATATN